MRMGEWFPLLSVTEMVPLTWYSDGVISVGELGDFMRRMGLTPTPGELKRMIAEVDADGTGSVDFSEFVTLMVRKVNNADKDAEIRAAFDVYDKDSSGKITAANLRTVMRTLGDLLTEEEVSGSRNTFVHTICSWRNPDWAHDPRSGL